MGGSGVAVVGACGSYGARCFDMLGRELKREVFVGARVGGARMGTRVGSVLGVGVQDTWMRAVVGVAWV